MTIPVDDPQTEVPIEDEPDLTEHDNFQAKVEHVYSIIKDDPDKQLLVMAEIHVFMATLDQAVRKMMIGGGPMAMLGKMMGGSRE